MYIPKHLVPDLRLPLYWLEMLYGVPVELHALELELQWLTVELRGAGVDDLSFPPCCGRVEQLASISCRIQVK